jgi:DNA polymerase-3 subunit gamma/tau
VIEIDAASNRGVEAARDLRERAMYAPSEPDRHKVYIVDEAHMLTREAWNALLKIIEEPPSGVVFVFATTEPQKIQQSAAPILSRCQRFDFKRIGVTDIMGQLRRVLKLEGVTAPDDALRLVARRADGGMRDGLSLMDQVLSLTGNVADPAAVRQVLGLVEDERFLELLDLLREGRHADVFGLVEALLDEGYDLVEFYHGFVDVLRGLLRSRLTSGTWMEVREDLRDAFRERAETFAPADLVRMLALASDLEANGSLRRSANPRLLLEMLLLRFSYLDRTVDLEELLRAVGGVPTGDDPADSGSPNPPQGFARRNEPTRDAALVTTPSTPTAPTAKNVLEPEGPVLGAAAAWERMLRAGGAPPGMGPLLGAATVLQGPEGAVHVRVPPGPALDRLRDPDTLRHLSDAFATHLGHAARIVVDLDESAAEPARITQDTVREDRLHELLQREPVLRRAVEELDLELLD